MSFGFRSSFVVSIMMVAAVACSSSSSGTDTSDGGSSGGGDGGGGGGGDGGGGGKDSGAGTDSGSSSSCTAVFTGSVGGSDVITIPCNITASENSNITTVGVNGTDTSGHTLECEYEFNGDLSVKNYANADSISMSTSLTAGGATATAGWQQVSSAAGDARGQFTGLNVTSVGTEHDLGGGKQWQGMHGTSTGTAEIFEGDAGTSSYAFTITF